LCVSSDRNAVQHRADLVVFFAALQIPQMERFLEESVAPLTIKGELMRSVLLWLIGIPIPIIIILWLLTGHA
jgi:hypothetical protein